MYRLRYLLLLIAIPGGAQDQPSVADAAKQARANAAPKSKVVITEENLKPQRGPIPDIAFEGLQNDPAIVAAIREYRATHTAAETEDLVREWFFYYDNMQLRLIKENNAMLERKQESRSYYYDPERDGKDYMQKARHEAQSAELDQQIQKKSGMMAGRIQMTLYGVRTGIAKFGLKYDWMKVHYGNGIQTYE